jgi:hyperosmotically inducible protein
MSERWLSSLIAAFILAAPLTAGAAPATNHAHPAKTTKAAKSAKTAKKPAKAAAPAPPPMLGPGGMSHRPPMPIHSTMPKSLQVPQAKSLADTPDVVLNSRVRAALLSALSKGGQDITAETTKGVVTLTGTVATPQDRARAEQAAKKMRGVRAVKNKLTVKSGAKVSKR